MALLNTGPTQGFLGGMMNKMHAPEMMQSFQNRPGQQPQQGNLGDAAGAIGAALAHRRHNRGMGVNPSAGMPNNPMGRINMMGGGNNMVQGPSNMSPPVVPPTVPPPMMGSPMGQPPPIGNPMIGGGFGIMDPNRMSGMQGGLWNAYNQNSMPNTAQEAPGLNRQVMY